MPPLQIIGRKGGDNPGQVRSAKTGHNALTAAGSAAGVMVPPFLTFKGKKEMQRLTDGAPKARYHLTDNGWPNQESWFKFCKHLVEWKDEQGLDKLLLLVDGADLHFHLPSILLLRENNIRLLAFPGGVTHKLQPLDVGVFAALEMLLVSYINDNFGVATNAKWAAWVAKAYKWWETHHNDKGEHPMTAAFRRAGLLPVNIGVFTSKDWAKSDFKLGLSEDHADVKKAKEMKLEELSLIIKSSAAASRPAVKEKLANHVKKIGFDLNMTAPTDDNVVEMLLEKAEGKAAEAAAKAQRKVDKEAKMAAKEEEAIEKAAAKKAKAAAKMEEATANEAAKAAKLAAKVAEAAAAVPSKSKKRKAVAAAGEGRGDEGDAYAKVYPTRSPETSFRRSLLEVL